MGLKCCPESKAERVLGIGVALCIIGAIFSAVTPDGALHSLPSQHFSMLLLIIPDAIVAVVGGLHYYLETQSPGFDHGTSCWASAGRGFVLIAVIVASLGSLPIAILSFIAGFPGVGVELAPATVIIAGACSLPGILAVLVASVCLRCGCANDASGPGGSQQHKVVDTTTAAIEAT